jgi:hypothetical protein
MIIEEEMLLAQKAAAKNLTIDQLLIVCELADDLEMHTDGAIQPLNLRGLAGGASELRLFGQYGWYRIEIHAGRIECMYQRFGESALTIHESDEYIAAWELLRSKILMCEGYECELQGNVDTCQKLTPPTKVNV